MDTARCSPIADLRELLGFEVNFRRSVCPVGFPAPLEHLIDLPREILFAIGLAQKFHICVRVPAIL